MLAGLSIQNVVLIEQLSMEFQPGLCALTGETGAGKSILLDSLGLALGGRSDSGLVRKGAAQAAVSAVFDVSKKHPAHAFLQAQGLQSESTLVLRRIVGADGKSRAFVNDQPVSVGLLKDLGEMLVEIHGQFETHGLLNPATHLKILDDYAGHAMTLPALWGQWQAAAEKLAQMKAEAEKARADEEYLRQALEDIDRLGPQAGEEVHLSDLRGRLMHREKALEGLNTAYDVLNGENDPVQKAAGILSRIADKLGEESGKIIAALDRASAEVSEAVGLIQSMSADLLEGEHNLESIDDRLHELRAQARKHNCTVDELSELRQTLAQRLNMIEHGDEVLAEQMRIVEKTRKSYIEEAKKISASRRKTAEKLDKLVQKELPPLKLEKAKFVTDIAELPENEWGPGGMDRVRFLISTNPGSAPGPLNKIASGGEMARFMLALKVVMAETSAAETMIFDEVDAGIGGATADAVGERLARLAKTCQVLVVTHSPQVAARAENHFIVLKGGTKDVKTNVLHLGDSARRREEIARMLSGASITDEARRAADKLLETGT